MSISDKTRKILWGRSGNRCAICHHELVMDATDLDDESIIGEECHIVAREINGPRGQAPLTLDERDSLDNLILLCRVHHKLIDDQANTYDIQHLKETKVKHETWVRETLNSQNQVRDDKLLLNYQERSSKNFLDDNLTSAIGKNYKKLRDFLVDEDWEAADKETRILMSEVLGKDVTSFPIVDLQTIDRLWLKYSSGRFGFSVQRRILDNTFSDSKVTPKTCLPEYEIPKSKEDKADRMMARWEIFVEKLGWYNQGQWEIFVDDYTQVLIKKPEGYLPFLGDLAPASTKIITDRGVIPWWWTLLLYLKPWDK